MKNTSIGIIGMGWVGSSVAISILQQGLCNELLVNDLKTEIAEGEAMDLNHGSSFYPTAKTRACAIDEMKTCRAIVITAGRGGKPGESRLDLLKENIKIVKEISEQLKGFEGILIVVANPVDVLTYFYQHYTGLPASKVIGTGTMLDTARLRDMVARKINIDPKSIHANVIGEHGDSEVILWSQAMVGSLPLRKWPNWQKSDEETITKQVKSAAQDIIKRKGATNHAIGLVTAALLKWLLWGERKIVNVSSVVNGSYGLEDVAISLPTIISADGVVEILEIDMDEQVRKKLMQSSEILKKAITSVDGNANQ